MPAFGPASAARLATCDERLQRVFNKVAETWNCTVIEGHRGEAAQHLAFVTHKSQLDWPNGNHNSKPSKACDVAPYPINWSDTHGFVLFAFFVLGVAAGMGIKLRWGGDWNTDFNIRDNKFNDLVHFEVLD